MLIALILFLIPDSTIAKSSPLEQFTTVSNSFALDLYKQISKTQSGNFLVSPFPVETLLALTLSGAGGSTADEIRKTIHFPNNTKAFHQTIKSLREKFNSTAYALRSATKIYIREKFRVKEGFRNVASEVFGAGCEEIDLGDKEEAAKRISSWIGNNTNNTIRDLVKADDLDDDVRAIFINALYFKGIWTNPFPSHSTKKRDFYKSGKEIVRVDTMHVYEKYFKYNELTNLKARILELPFRGRGVSMVVVLPDDKDGLKFMENHLDSDVISPSRNRLTDEYLNVALPKFQMKSSTNIKSVLRDLGVREIFEPDRANLSGISEGLVVDRIVQKSFIDLNEGGVEAGAGTYFSFGARSWQLETPKEFVVDRPFIFSVRVEGLVVFVGRVADPSRS